MEMSFAIVIEPPIMTCHPPWLASSSSERKLMLKSEKKKTLPGKPRARDAEERKQRAGFRKINCASKIAQVASYEDLMEQLGSGAAFQKGAL